MDEEEDLCAVPPHIMRIMQQTEEKKTDMAKISNARDIFKQREAIEQEGDEAPKPRAEKQKRVDVCVGFLNDNKNKAEEMRQARLREMARLRSRSELTFALDSSMTTRTRP